MNKTIKSILKTLEDNGYEAYIVGGYVRDFLLDKSSNDIDICTNALPKDVIRLFPGGSLKNEEYGAVKILIGEYNIDITTYRIDKKYQDRRPTEVQYCNDLETDLQRRDFTINSIVMDKDSEIIDKLGGLYDLTNKTICVIGDVNEKLVEDPLRILRAIRFATVLDFELEKKLYKALKNNSKLVKTLSKERIKYELNCILLSEHLRKGINLLKDLKILDALEIRINNIVPSADISSLWAQIECSDDYFTKEELKNIKKIKEILSYGKIDNDVLYNYGLYLGTVAGKIMGINLEVINTTYENLPIKTRKDIVINGKDIMEILNLGPSNKIQELMNDLEDKILSNKLENNYEKIVEYLKE